MRLHEAHVKKFLSNQQQQEIKKIKAAIRYDFFEVRRWMDDWQYGRGLVRRCVRDQEESYDRLRDLCGPGSRYSYRRYDAMALLERNGHYGMMP